MRYSWFLVLFAVILVDVVVPADINAAKPSDFTTLTRDLATDDNALQSKPLLRKADSNRSDSADVTERLMLVGTIRNKLRSIIARIKQSYRDFKSDVNNGYIDNWILFGAVMRR